MVIASFLPAPTGEILQSSPDAQMAESLMDMDMDPAELHIDRCTMTKITLPRKKDGVVFLPCTAAAFRSVCCNVLEAMRHSSKRNVFA
jgi:hypothetical protein